MAIPPHLTGQQLYNFIGGRRRYNFARQMKATNRRWRLIFYWAKNPHLRKADLARHFGVSRSTITRDIQAVKNYTDRYPGCPLCKGRGYVDIGPDLATLSEVRSDLARRFN